MRSCGRVASWNIAGCASATGLRILADQLPVHFTGDEPGQSFGDGERDGVISVLVQHDEVVGFATRSAVRIAVENRLDPALLVAAAVGVTAQLEPPREEMGAHLILGCAVAGQ